jgi:hypothetical protein
MRMLELALAVATLAAGCGSSSSLDETQPVVTIPDDSRTTSPSPPSELAPASTELDDVEPPKSRDDVARAAEHAVKAEVGVRRLPSGQCLAIDCP